MQVWEQTPGYGGEPFLDTLWSAIDEVSCRLAAHQFDVVID